MRLTKNVLALIVLAIGAIWSLQGIGLVGGSFMTGQSRWLYIGIVTMLVGLAGLVWANRSRIRAGEGPGPAFRPELRQNKDIERFGVSLKRRSALILAEQPV